MADPVANRAAPARRNWPSDQLISAAQSGDVESISALVASSHPHVRRFAHSLCASTQDAEDATQEALIVLYNKIGTLRASAALASWMFRIVRNECLRRIALAVRQRGEVVGGVDEWTKDRLVLSAEEEVMQRLEVARVASAIAVLPEDQRRVLIMRDIQGHSGKMVAQVLGLSTAAMKSRLHRARAAVQAQLEGAA